MDNGVDLVQPRWFGMPEIAFDDFESIVRWKGIAEPEGVDHPYPLAKSKELAHQYAANIARTAGNKNHPLPLFLACAARARPRTLARPEYGSGGNSTLTCS